MYFVWIRNDGYIDVTKGGMPRDYVTGGDYRTREGSGKPVTFQQLGQFHEWSLARRCIVMNRAAAGDKKCIWEMENIYNLQLMLEKLES